MKLLFVHQKLGEFGGAEANIRLSAGELANFGLNLGLLHNESTGQGESEWRRLFSSTFKLPEKKTAEFTRKALSNFAPDVIYLHNLSDLEVLETLLDSGVPVVRMVHDHALYCMRSYKYNYFTRKICTRAFSPFCVFPCLASIGRNHQGPLPLKWVSYFAKKREIELNKRCARLIVYSEYLKQELIRNGFEPDKIEVCVPIRVWNDETRLSTFSERNLVLFAGQLIRGKGVDVLLQALAKVRTHFECAILGDGNHRHYSEKLCQRLGLGNRVHFHGYVLPTELGRFYQEASVFVMGSIWPEPFGMAGPEAMRYGLPVIAFDAGGIREWLTDGENGFLIPWRNVDLFAARLEQLLRDKEMARAIGRNAFEIVQRYDSGRQIAHLRKIFQNTARAGLRTLPPQLPSETHLPAYE
ncbi:MAG TPA: glycosyltransferase family 4 protein [Verrucomicrobiae bacterium]|nr:glycosyltransferase family 4 protein [Verrucomicrobiae bacterium]